MEGFYDLTELEQTGLQRLNRGDGLPESTEYLTQLFKAAWMRLNGGQGGSIPLECFATMWVLGRVLEDMGAGARDKPPQKPQKKKQKPAPEKEEVPVSSNGFVGSSKQDLLDLNPGTPVTIQSTEKNGVPYPGVFHGISAKGRAMVEVDYRNKPLHLLPMQVHVPNRTLDSTGLNREYQPGSTFSNAHDANF